MAYCVYYKEHSINKFLSKYQIKDWYEDYLRNEMKAGEQSLILLQNKFSVHYPKEYYSVKLLKYFPIIIDELVFSSENVLNEVLIDCIPFADTSFDYLIVVSSCKQGEVYSTALQIPRQTFKKIIQSYETKNDESLKNMIVPPYPVNVTEQMLNCFTEKYNLPITDGYNSLPVGDIIEELWVYSKARELLTGPADKDYCSKELQDIRNKIERLLHSLEEKIPLDNVKSLVEISKDVFNGSIFDDNSFNELVDQYDKHKMFS